MSLWTCVFSFRVHYCHHITVAIFAKGLYELLFPIKLLANKGTFFFNLRGNLSRLNRKLGKCAE